MNGPQQLKSGTQPVTLARRTLKKQLKAASKKMQRTRRQQRRLHRRHLHGGTAYRTLQQTKSKHHSASKIKTCEQTASIQARYGKPSVRKRTRRLRLSSRRRTRTPQHTAHNTRRQHTHAHARTHTQERTHHHRGTASTTHSPRCDHRATSKVVCAAHQVAS